MTHEEEIAEWLQKAVESVKECLAVKDSRMTKEALEMKKIAREWYENNTYIFTAKDINDKYGNRVKCLPMTGCLYRDAAQVWTICISPLYGGNQKTRLEFLPLIAVEEPKRYTFSCVNGQCMCIDNYTGYFMTWETGKFNETQKVGYDDRNAPFHFLPEEMANAVAGIAREMGEYLFENFNELL